MKKVLVVEDDPFTADLYCDKLEAAGYVVDCAESGREAIRRVDAMPPDLVLLDLMVGEVSGVEVIRHLRGQAGTRDLPVIVLTNAFMSDLLTEAWNAGATNCLNKVNCSPVRLVEAIRTTLLIGARKDHGETLEFRRPVRTGLPVGNGRGDPEYHLWLRPDLLASVQARVHDTASALHAWTGHERDTTGPAFTALEEAVHALGAAAALAGFFRGTQLLSALEALLDEVRVEPRKLTPSVFRTVGQAIGALPAMLEQLPASVTELPAPPLILIVDDEPVAREIAMTALEKAQMTPVTLDDPGLALRLCEQNAFHLVLLDIEMPGMDGFELCERIHNTPLNLQTPVVFITARDEPETRGLFAHSGGVDFIGKPVMLNELAVKTLIHLERGTLALGN